MMRASVGDRVVIAPVRVDGPVRDGEVLAAAADGGPPYRVRWSDTGRESLFFPGPDAHIAHEGAEPETTAPTPDVGIGSGEPAHVKHWRVDLYLYEGRHTTSAQAVLHGDAAEDPRSFAVARRRPGDPDVPEVGDEIAVARALRRMADRLIDAAGADLEQITGEPAVIAG